jgi:hypothetical protein
MTKQVAKVTEFSIPTVLETLKSELNNLKSITESNYKTDGKIEGYATGIQEETKVEKLISMYASIKLREQAYNTAAQDLGLKSYPLFKLSGNTSESIKHDVLLKIAIIEHADRKKELEQLVKEAESFMTKEDQQKIFMNKMQNLLTK